VSPAGSNPAPSAHADQHFRDSGRFGLRSETPFANGLLYVAKYQLELGLGFIDDADALRRLRKQQLRSHLEAPWATERTIEHPALDEFLAANLASDLRSKEAGRVFRMICGYFEDMSAVLAGLRTVLHRAP
jgi:hypothetical protein